MFRNKSWFSGVSGVSGVQKWHFLLAARSCSERDCWWPEFCQKHKDSAIENGYPIPVDGLVPGQVEAFQSRFADFDSKLAGDFGFESLDWLRLH